MIDRIYKIAKRILPQWVKTALLFLFREKVNTLAKFRYYKLNNMEVGLFFGAHGKKRGFITVGFKKHNDIVLKDRIKLFLPNNSIDEIYVENFVHQLDNDKTISFFRECLRVLKPGHRITMEFINSDIVFEKYIKDKKYFRQEKYRNIKDRYMFGDEIDIVNSILFGEFKTQKLLNLKNVVNFLTKTGFDLIEREKNCGQFHSCIVARKNAERELLNKFAPQLIKDKISSDVPIYFYNCDPIWILENFKNINRNKIINRNFASVIGSLYFINLIPYLKPKDLYLFDINDYQVRYLKLFIEILKISDSFENFLENLFVRKYKSNVEEFLKSKFDSKIHKKVYDAITDKKIFKASIEKIAHGQYLKLSDSIPALKISNNSMCRHIAILGEELFRPGPGVNVIYTKEGLADNFDYVKKILLKATIETALMESTSVYDFIKNNGIIYVSNIGETDWLYGARTMQNTEKIVRKAEKSELTKSFVRQLEHSSRGFHKFLQNIKDNFWIIDSVGNIFNTQELLKYRSSAHAWLWQKIKPLIYGKVLELVHKEESKWGFKEYLKTKNVDDYIKNYSHKSFDTIVFHILLGNGVSINTFRKALKVAATNCKRIIVLEHDRDSVSFEAYTSGEIIDIRTLLNILRSVKEVNKANISVEWSGAGLSDNKANFSRNFIISIDL